MTEIFVVKVSCPALFIAVETIAKEAGYRWSIPCRPNSKNSYIGFRDDKTMDTSSYKECLKDYNVVYNASTQFEEIRKLLKPNKVWKFACNSRTIELIDGKLYIGGFEISKSVIKEIWEAMNE